MSLKNKKHLLAISLPIIIIGICIFWIVRLELNAAALASRVDDLHNSLKQNKDELTNLESFIREVNKSGITLDKNGGLIYKGDSEIFWDEDILQMVNGDIRLEIGDYVSSTGTKNGMLINIADMTGTQVSFHLTKKEVKLLTNENTEIMIGVRPKKSRILLTKEGAKLELGKDKDFYVNLSHDLQQIELKKGESKITIGET
ncbi:MAG: hypothetical protein HKM87_07570, partial [Ignavibacteriaceae bacterium]|nr:hypothetical protein [Ignavibacteriaceae bacterium]